MAKEKARKRPKETDRESKSETDCPDAKKQERQKQKARLFLLTTLLTIREKKEKQKARSLLLAILSAIKEKKGQTIAETEEEGAKKAKLHPLKGIPRYLLAEIKNLGIADEKVRSALIGEISEEIKATAEKKERQYLDDFNDDDPLFDRNTDNGDNAVSDIIETLHGAYLQASKDESISQMEDALNLPQNYLIKLLVLASDSKRRFATNEAFIKKLKEKLRGRFENIFGFDLPQDYIPDRLLEKLSPLANDLKKEFWGEMNEIIFLCLRFWLIGEKRKALKGDEENIEKKVVENN